jgi:hypothetical protein
MMKAGFGKKVEPIRERTLEEKFENGDIKGRMLDLDSEEANVLNAPNHIKNGIQSWIMVAKKKLVKQKLSRLPSDHTVGRSVHSQLSRRPSLSRGRSMSRGPSQSPIDTADNHFNNFGQNANNKVLMKTRIYHKRV